MNGVLRRKSTSAVLFALISPLVFLSNEGEVTALSMKLRTRPGINEIDESVNLRELELTKFEKAIVRPIVIEFRENIKTVSVLVRCKNSMNIEGQEK